MAFLGQEFRQEDLPKDEGNFEPIPAGWYSVTITKAEVKDTKAGTGEYIHMRMDVMGPTHQGRVLFANLNLRNPNPKAEEIGRQQLNSVITALGIPAIRDSDQLIGGQLQVKVAIRHEPPRDPENEVKGYKAISGSSMPAASSKPSDAPGKAAAAPPWAKK